MSDTDQGLGGSSPHTDQGKGSSSPGIWNGHRDQLFISDSIQAKGVAGVKALLQNLKLEAPATPLDPFSVEMACYLKANTRRQYHVRWRQMKLFFYAIGCYRSALLVDFDHSPTKGIPPMVPRSVMLFLQFKISKKGEPLMEDGKPVKDVDGNPIVCSGCWNAPNVLYYWHAAVAYIHETAHMDYS